MIIGELTGGLVAATTRPMQGKQQEPRSGWRAARAATMLAAGSLAMSGCISVSAPDKPIVIELNINIKQEVIYRLSADAANTIDKNKDIF
jgi:YnbE-like lipoprotein